MNQLISLVAKLWVIKVSDLGGLINEFDPREDWRDQVSGCLVLIIYGRPIIHRERHGASSSKPAGVSRTAKSEQKFLLGNMKTDVIFF